MSKPFSVRRATWPPDSWEPRRREETSPLMETRAGLVLPEAWGRGGASSHAPSPPPPKQAAPIGSFETGRGEPRARGSRGGGWAGARRPGAG